jgi:hypothetical protein
VELQVERTLQLEDQGNDAKSKFNAFEQAKMDIIIVVDEDVKIVSFIRSSPLKSRVFSALCDEMGSLYRTLLLHANDQ